MSLKKIAIIGSGFAGAALAWHLSHYFEVTVFSDNREASRVSAGILHKYIGLYARLNPLAIEAEKDTHELLKVAEKYADQPLILSKGIIRLAYSEKQKAAFSNCIYNDIEWFNSSKKYDEYLSDAPGIFISSGLTINTDAYLNALLKASKINVINKHITSENELDCFDHVVMAMGAYFPEDVHPLKGQTLKIQWPKKLPPLPHTIIGEVYLAMDEECALIGATFEHTFSTQDPDPEIAIPLLLPKALKLYPSLEKEKIIEVKAGLRATTKNRMPIVKIISKRASVFTGLGSRGLLYHAHFAKKLAFLLKNL